MDMTSPAPLSPCSTDSVVENPHPLQSIENDPTVQSRADALFTDLLSLSRSTDKDRAQARATVDSLGHALQKESARQSQLLQAPVQQLAGRAEDGGEVANALIDLKVQVESLDPAGFDLSPGWWSRLAGRLPFIGTPLKRYFSRYESASTVIASIVNSLDAGRKQLERDNITLKADQSDMRQLTDKLARAIEVGKQVDAQLERSMERDHAEDEDLCAFIQENLLFPLRQRIMDLQQQLAVNQQGILTIEVILQNNRELIRGVDRATQVTVSALQIAVTLALSLAHQKVVLDKIDAVNRTTDELIAGTASQLRAQGADIQARAASSQLDLETLKRSFQDINTALDDIAGFRQQALPAMGQAVSEMTRLTDKAASRINTLSESRGSKLRLEPDLN
ncbi:toxic anion resistance protein [Marinobacter sp. M1N3S26]|uniref:toxic anion resistance protein n=1 Tax=Marinobacter sp. M1N3S26 TaxID=3382299 RepID=UPI00387B9D27